MPYYIGFRVGECELGLDPNAFNEGLKYPIAYWSVDEVQKTGKKYEAKGAKFVGNIQDIGGGMHMARIKDKSGNIFGIIDGQN